VDEPSRSDQITDALIRGGLIRTDGDATCPDPSLLAGLHEGGLEPDESERWMTHLAECRRCQATLAALARADVEAPTAHAPAHSWWSYVQRGLRWPVLVPLAAGAVIVLAVWVVDPGSTVGPRRSTPQRSTDAAPQSAAIPTSQPVRESTSERASPTADRTFGENAAGLAQDEDAGVVTDNASALSEEVLETAPAQAEPGAVARRPLPEALSSARARARPADAAALLRAAEPSDPVADPVVLSSPQDRRRWRAGLDGNIARTDDDGQTWRVQLNVAERVRAGAAPSIDVAWLVGDRGLVLRTLDGEQWVRTSVPVAASLAGIEASDELRATVTTADGRRFRTVDGGAGWTLVP
jgi:hypothetical protein